MKRLCDRFVSYLGEESVQKSVSLLWEDQTCFREFIGTATENFQDLTSIQSENKKKKKAEHR